MDIKKKTSFTFKLTAQQQDELYSILSTGNYVPREVPYTKIAVSSQLWNCNINLYTSGKCLIQGSGAEEFVINIMEPSILKQIVVGYEDELIPEQVSQEQLSPHIGIDESGKGDFFGPLVVAAAYTNEDLYKRLRDIGVKDSKAITSDKQAIAIAEKIKKILGPTRYAIVRIGNAAYNRLYAKYKSINTILAWGHARAIENLITNIPSCKVAIADQFGKSEDVIKRALMQKGKSIELRQRHKAEADVAVAAASILAREAFLTSLKQLEEKYENQFHKGASPLVQEDATSLAEKHGINVFLETAKCHFKTLDDVLQKSGYSRDQMPEEARVRSADKAALASKPTNK